MLDHRLKGREIGWLRGLRWHVLWWRRKTMALEEAILVVVSARCFLFSFVTKDFFRDGWCVAFVFVLLQLMKPYAARIIFGAFAVTAVMAFCSRSWNMQSSAAWQKVTPDSLERWRHCWRHHTLVRTLRRSFAVCMSTSILQVQNARDEWTSNFINLGSRRNTAEEWNLSWCVGDRHGANKHKPQYPWY